MLDNLDVATVAPPYQSTWAQSVTARAEGLLIGTATFASTPLLGHRANQAGKVATSASGINVISISKMLHGNI